MKYTIKNFARMQGLTVDTVRQYEKKGIILPVQDEENGYRYYSDLDIRIVSTSKWYSSLGFTLSEIAKFIRNLSKKDLAEAFSERILMQEKQIAVEMEKLEELKRFNEYFRMIERGEGHYEKVTLPDLIWLPHSDQDVLFQDQEVLEHVREWVELLPMTFFSRWIPLDSALGKEPFTYYMAIVTTPEKAKAWDLPRPSFTRSAAEGEYIQTMIRKPDEEVLSATHVDPVLRTVEDMGYALTGDILTMFVASDCLDGAKYNYHILYLPVRRR